MKVLIQLSTSLGVDCMGCSHDLDDSVEVNLDDMEYEILTSLLDEDGEVTDEVVEERAPGLYEVIDTEVQRRFHTLMVIDGWENHGWEACIHDISTLIEEDKENGDFEGCDDEDEEMELWEEKEEELRGEMSEEELAAYLEGHYGLDTDTSWMHCGWKYQGEPLS